MPHTVGLHPPSSPRTFRTTPDTLKGQGLRLLLFQCMCLSLVARVHFNMSEICGFQYSPIVELPWLLSGQDPELPMQGAQIPFLVEELRSRMLHGLAKKKKKKTLQLGLQHSKGANRRVGSFKKLDCTSSSSVSIVELPRSPRLLVGGPQPLVILTGLCYGGKGGEGTLPSVHSAPIHLHSPYRFCCLPHKELYFRAMVTLFFDVKD